MRKAAAVMNPTITEWDTTFTSDPSRTTPSANWMTPTRHASTMAASMNAGLPTSWSPDSVANTSAEIAVVGPDTAYHDAPRQAATTGGTVAV